MTPQPQEESQSDVPSDAHSRARAAVPAADWRSLTRRLLHVQRESTDPDVILSAAVGALGRELHAAAVGFFEVRDDEMLHVTARWSSGALPPFGSSVPVASLPTQHLACLRSGQAVRVSPSAALPFAAADTSPALPATYWIAAPVVRNGRWLAGLYLAGPEPRAWTDDELSLACDVADHTWDAAERARAQAALRDAEERLRLAADAAELGVWVWHIPQDRVTWENERLHDLFGLPPTAEPVSAARFRSDFIHPDDSPALERAIADALQAGTRLYFQGRFRRPDGDLRWVELTGKLHRAEDGTPLRIVGTAADLTARKRAESRDRLLVQLDDVMRPLTDPQALTQVAAALLGQHLDADRCAYADVEPDENTFNLTGDYNRGVPSIVGRYTFAQFGAECLKLMRAGDPYVVEDSETDPRTEDVRASYRLTLIRSVVCVPLHKGGQLVAAMAVHQTRPRTWREEEIDLVRQVAARCWESIQRTRIARELREREHHYRFLAESIPQMVWTATPDGALDYVSDQVIRYFGLAAGALTGAGWLQGVHPEDRESTVEHWQHSVRTGEPYESGFRLRRGSDGAWRWHLVRALPLTDSDGSVVRWFGTCTDVEDLKRAEAHLQRQWHTFDTALSNTLDFAYVFDLEGRFTYVNRALLSLWRKPLDAAVGRNFFDLGYPPDLAERLQAQIQQVIATKEPLRDRTPFTGPTGETRHYEYIFVPVKAADGQVESVAGSTRDITDQKRTEDLVEEDRRRWRDLLLQMPAAIAVLRGPEHRFDWVNADYVRLVGRPAESLVGRAVLEALPEVESQVYIPLLNRVYQTGEPFTGHESPLRLEGSDGVAKDLYVNFVYVATRGVTGEVDGVFVHATDVTDMVLARRRVEESERQFRTLAETIPHLAWMADETGHIFWYNRRWYDYTGTTFRDMEGWGWQAVHDPAVLPDVLARWTGAIANGVPFEMVFPLRAADNSFRSFLTRVEPVRDLQGRVVRWFGTNTDITDQRRTEEELRRLNRGLEEFAYVASHDLQEPLRMVNSYTQLLLRRLGPQAGDDMHEYAGYVRTGVRRMETLIRDLLAYSRETHHAAEASLATADLNDAFRQALTLVETRLRESGAEVSADPLPVVAGDVGQWAHVFQNLLSNAVKYRKAVEAPRIHLGAQERDGQWVISMRDNGIGFAPEYAERIFGLFKRLHRSDEYAGTGLGLAICRRIVERYGGTMWAESQEGIGSTFFISLPKS